MISNPWPQQQQPQQVGYAPQGLTDQQVQQTQQALNNLIEQFNWAVVFLLSLEKEIKSIPSLHIYDGTHDSYLLNNAVMKNWPGTEFIIGKTISGTNYPQLTLTPGSTGSPGSTVFSAAAGSLTVGGDITATGNLIASATYIAGGGTYHSASGTAGGNYSSGGAAGIVFQQGLYISGTFGTGGAGTGVPEVGSTAFYVRTLTDGSDDVGTWCDLSIFLPGITAGTEAVWVGSTYLTTLGTVTTGTWNAGAIDTASSVTCDGLVTTTITTSGDADLGGALTVGDISTLNGEVTCAASGSGLTVTNNAIIGGTIAVAGASTLIGEVTCAASGTGLAVTHNATIGGTLGVTGATTLASMTVSGASSQQVITCIAIRPQNDVPYALQIQNNDGSKDVIVVTTNGASAGNVGINTLANTLYDLDVVGAIHTGSYLKADLSLRSPLIVPLADGGAAIAFKNTTASLTAMTIDTSSGGINVNKFISPINDTVGLGIWNAAGNSEVLRFDTTNLICYPTHLVLPTS